MAKFLVDNQEIEADEKTVLLQACLDNGIYIPNLCFIKGMDHPSASCRMCFVEIEGERQPVPSCTINVRDGMVVKTDTPQVRQLQRTAFQLLMSVHDVDCKNCPSNKKCELQRIAKFLKVSLKPKSLEIYLKEPRIDQSHPFLDYYPNRCVLCGRCVYTCGQRNAQSFLAFSKRGFNTVVSFYGAADLSTLDCPNCHACVDVCPVGALALRESSKKTVPDSPDLGLTPIPLEA
jgi:NADH dehydrogenase/NADH:ubiquinone oxidoreductase subunit G